MTHSCPPEKPLCLNNPGSYLLLYSSFLRTANLSSSAHSVSQILWSILHLWNQLTYLGFYCCEKYTMITEILTNKNI